MTAEPVRGHLPTPRRRDLHPETFELGDLLREVTRHVNWSLDIELELVPSSPIQVTWDRRWIKEAIWLLAETFIARGNLCGAGTLGARLRDGWVLLDFEAPPSPQTEGVEIPRLVQTIAEALGGTLQSTRSPELGILVTLTLPHDVTNS